MTYISGKSSNKIVHHSGCRYIKMIPKCNRKYFLSMNDAMDIGYSQCRYCSGIEKYLREEKRFIKPYCKKYGIYYGFNPKDGSVDIVSSSGKWKIILEKHHKRLVLYHKNNHVVRLDDPIPGYHKQKSASSSLNGHFEYIVDHDEYRKNNPIYGNHKKKRGTKARRRLRIREEKYRKIQGMRFVNNLLDELAVGNIS